MFFIPVLRGQIAFTSGACFMNEILSNLAQDCHRILSKTPGPDGREKIAELLQNLLSDPANVETLVPLTTGERDLLYQDAELGFCILAHNYDSPKTSPPHDHGPSWAIYAQTRGETEMRDPPAPFHAHLSTHPAHPSTTPPTDHPSKPRP